MTINDYATLTDIKTAMPNSDVAATTNYDTLATGLLTILSRAIDLETNREPGAYYVSADSTLFFDGPNQDFFAPIYGFRTQRLTSGYTGAIALRVGEIATFPTEVAVAETGQVATGGDDTSGTYTVWPLTDMWAEPQRAAHFGRPYNVLVLDIINGTHRYWYPFRRGIRIKGKFGYSAAVPADMKEAVILFIVALLKKAQGNYQEVATILDNGQILQANKQDVYIPRILGLYRRQAI